MPKACLSSARYLRLTALAASLEVATVNQGDAERPASPIHGVSQRFRWPLQTVSSLLALEDERDGLALRPDDGDHHAGIRGKRVAFESNGAGFRRCHLQNVMIPFGLTLEVLAAVNCGIVLAASAVAVEESFSCTFVLETARDHDDALLIVDRHRASLEHGLAGEIALGRRECPNAIENSVVACESRACEEARQERSDSRGPQMLFAHFFNARIYATTLSASAPVTAVTGFILPWPPVITPFKSPSLLA